MRIDQKSNTQTVSITKSHLKPLTPPPILSPKIGEKSTGNSFLKDTENKLKEKLKNYISFMSSQDISRGLLTAKGLKYGRATIGMVTMSLVTKALMI